MSAPLPWKEMEIKVIHPSYVVQLALSETVKHMQDGNLLKMLKEWKFLGGLKLLCYWVPFITVYFVWIKVDRMEKQWLSGTAEQLWDWGGGGGTISDLILGWHKTHIFLLILYNFKNIGGTRAPQPPPPPTPRSLIITRIWCHYQKIHCMI